MLANIDNLFHFMVLKRTFLFFKNAVSSLLHTNQQIMSNVVGAVHGRVTPSLFPVKDFMHALELGKKEYGLTPLFDIKGLHHYYPLLTSFITTNDIVIHVPFQSNDVFEAHEIEPFPFAVNGSLMTLDLPPSIVLISADFAMYATGSVTDLQKCRTEYLSYFHCPAYLFAFLPITGGVCEVVLTQKVHKHALELCPYTTLVNNNKMFHKTFFSHHYFFFTKPFYISIVCPEGTVYKEVSGHLAVYFACYVHSANLSTFPSKLHQGFVQNSTARIYPLTILDNIHLSSIKYVNNKVSEFKFSKTSDLETVVQDVLPNYLHPYILYPSFIIPVVVIIVILIPLCCYVRKSLTLYNILQSRRVTARNEETNV